MCRRARAIKYLIEQRDIEVWLVPIAATRVVVPFRLIVPTPMGMGVLQATQFVDRVTEAARRGQPRKCKDAAPRLPEF